MEYNLAFIPSDFEEQAKEAFDPEYMSKLFDLGYEMAKNGCPWKKAPPVSNVPDNSMGGPFLPECFNLILKRYTVNH